MGVWMKLALFFMVRFQSQDDAVIGGEGYRDAAPSSSISVAAADDQLPVGQSITYWMKSPWNMRRWIVPAIRFFSSAAVM